jgi:hypothetical protein
MISGMLAKLQDQQNEEAKHEVTESSAPPAPANASRFVAPEAATGGGGGFLAPRAPVEYHVADNGSDEFNGRPHVERQADLALASQWQDQQCLQCELCEWRCVDENAIFSHQRCLRSCWWLQTCRMCQRRR